jgi:hypothetical protein
MVSAVAALTAGRLRPNGVVVRARRGDGLRLKPGRVAAARMSGGERLAGLLPRAVAAPEIVLAARLGAGGGLGDSLAGGFSKVLDLACWGGGFFVTTCSSSEGIQVWRGLSGAAAGKPPQSVLQS